MITMKQFCYEEAERQGVTMHAIEVRIWRGRYPAIALEPLNRKEHKVLNQPPYVRGQWHKLTDEQAQEIRSTPKWWGSGKMLAEKFGVSKATITFIRNGKSYNHLTPNERKL